MKPSVTELLRLLLAHPLTAGMCLDDPGTTELRKQIIQSKPILRGIYDEWYRKLANALPPGTGSVLELGSGAGYLDRYIPNLITSEVLPCRGVGLVADAQRLPFRDESLRAIVFTDVLHHIPNVRSFFAEASRCVRPGGRVLMIEPWVSRWSRFVWGRLHHEPFLPGAADWSFPATGPLSGANGAIPWIVLERDRAQFESEFPTLAIAEIRPFMPFRYLVSGGLALRSLAPGFSQPIWAALERMVQPRIRSFAMFAFVSLHRR